MRPILTRAASLIALGMLGYYSVHTSRQHKHGRKAHAAPRKWEAGNGDRANNKPAQNSLG